jgi:hypothetical protein
MGTSLSGLTPQNTYQGLLKFGDNSAISASLKAISDGAGNDTMLELSTTALQIGGSTGMYWDNTNKRLGIGTNTPLYNLDVVETTGSLDAVFTNSDATSNITFYQDNDQAKGLRLQSYGSTASGTLLDGTINRANSTVYRTNDSSNPMVFGGFANSSDRVYFGRNSFTLALNNTTNNVTIGASSGTARLFIKGSGSTSATTSLLVQNSAGTDAFRVRDDGQVVLGTDTDLRVTSGQQVTFRYGVSVGTLSPPNSSAILQADSTTKGFLPPRMTTTQKNAISSPAAGLVVYDNTVNRASVYSTAWENVITEVNASPNAVSNVWSGSQAQYDALTPNASTLYFIV